MIGSIGSRTELKCESATTPMTLIAAVPVPGSNSSLRSTFPTASPADGKPSLRAAGIQDDIHSTLRELDLLTALEGEIESHVVSGPIRVEPTPGKQSQPHRVENAGTDGIFGQRHLMIAAGRNDAAGIVAFRRDSDEGEPDRVNARDTFHLLLDHF